VAGGSSEPVVIVPPAGDGAGGDAPPAWAPPAPGAAPARPRVALVALGCRVNRAEVDALAAELRDGFDLAGEGEPADLVVVNTCAITGDAEAAARQAVRRTARERPGARIVATGCYAEIAPDAFRELPGVAAVVGARSAGELPAVLRRLAREAAGGAAGAASAEPLEPAAPAPAGGRAPRWGPPPVERYLHTRPFLKVQDGCDAGCAYCVVPLARGPSRSMPFEEAVRQLQALGRAHAEVVLTGVHLGAYGEDLAPARSLADLVRAAAASGAVHRLRLSSVEPPELPRDLLLDRATAPFLCEHFHLPLQSGSPRLLAAMGRPYLPAAFREVVQETAALVPGACIGTDVMTGFPGETDADHAATLALVESLPLAYLHVFPFSPRPGTVAAALPDPVPPQVAKARARELLAVSDRRWRAFLAAQIGREAEVVVERVEGGFARGTSRQYATVRWPASREARGALARVRIEAVAGAECLGVRASAFRERLPP
jgi:threonylcarbamoyladenosine tRNA methylthiotransferase MtaB